MSIYLYIICTIYKTTKNPDTVKPSRYEYAEHEWDEDVVVTCSTKLSGYGFERSKVKYDLFTDWVDWVGTIRQPFIVNTRYVSAYLL